MDKNLRRKGQGETQRPTCPICKQDLDRASTRVLNPETGNNPPKSFGSVCVKCKYILWDH